MSIVVSMLMGCLLGFAAHRAGLCTVKAVAEVLTARRAHFLWSFIKSALVGDRPDLAGSHDPDLRGCVTGRRVVSP